MLQNKTPLETVKMAAKYDDEIEDIDPASQYENPEYPVVGDTDDSTC